MSLKPEHKQELLKAFEDKQRQSRQSHLFTTFLLMSLLCIVFLVWAQAQTPHPGHSPSQIGPGMFSAGDYIIPGNLNVSYNITVQNLTIQNKIMGAGLTSCAAPTNKVLYNSTTGNFSCGTDQTSDPNLASSCVFLGTATTSNLIIPAPACLSSYGMCRLKCYNTNNRLVISTDIARKNGGNIWNSIGMFGSSGGAGVAYNFGTLGNGISETYMDWSYCGIFDDANGVAGNIMLESGGSDYYVCP